MILSTIAVKTWSPISVINIKAISVKIEFLYMKAVARLSLPKLENLQFMFHNVTTNFPLEFLLLSES